MSGAIEKILGASSLYEVLEVKKGASAAEIRKQYLKKSVAVHPDRCQDPRATAAFQRVSEAYDTLYNEQKRAEYDTQAQSKAYEQPMPPPDFSFEDALRVFRTAVRATQMARGVTEVDASGLDDILQLASAIVAIRDVGGALGGDVGTVATVAGGLVAGASVAAALLPQTWRQSIREHITPETTIRAIGTAALVAGVVARALTSQDEHHSRASAATGGS